jgi:hypothetical protein
MIHKSGLPGIFPHVDIAQYQIISPQQRFTAKGEKERERVLFKSEDEFDASGRVSTLIYA